MEHDTNSELVNIHLAYGACNSNGRDAQRLYAKCNAKRKPPSHASFACLHKSLSDSGSFIVDSQKHKRSVRTPNNEEIAMNLVQNYASNLQS
ncbi:DUF4817 domain-containing protein [Trichonephila clavipes]|nr:DUF4817 domain-containing protein [Trichonephila clavipes]